MWGFFIKASVSGGLIVFLLLHQNLKLLIHKMAEIHLGPLFTGTVLFTGLNIILAMRWSAILQTLASSRNFRTIIKLVFIGQFFSQVFPSGVGSDVARMWLAKNNQIPLAVAVSSVAVDRLSGLIPVLVLATASLPFLITGAPINNLTKAMVLLLAIAYCGFVIILLLDRAPLPLERFKIGRGLCKIASDARLALFTSHAAIKILTYSFLNQTGIVLVVYIIAGSLNIPVNLSSCLLVVPVSNLLQALPISIGGWGVRESSFVACFGLFGLLPQDALSISVVFGLVNLIASLPGSILWLWQRDRTSGSAVPMLQKSAKKNMGHD